MQIRVGWGVTQEGDTAQFGLSLFSLFVNLRSLSSDNFFLLLVFFFPFAWEKVLQRYWGGGGGAMLVPEDGGGLSLFVRKGQVSSYGLPAENFLKVFEALF